MHPIHLLSAQYFQQVDPPHLALPDGRTLVSPAIQSAIYESMFNEETAWPLPPIPYQTRVLKTILSRLEESISDPEEDEISEDLLSTWTTLLSHPKRSAVEQAQKLTYIKYTAPSFTSSSSHTTNSNNNNNLEHVKQIPARTIITSESRGLILYAGTTGFRTWEAALHLGTYLASTSAGNELVKNKRVLELGAGTGFLSMFCAKHLGPQSVFVTDREPALIDSIEDCIGRNGLDRENIQSGIWEWGNPLIIPGADSEGRDSVEFDVALGADLIYDVDLVPLLVSTIQDLFNHYKLKKFVISATVRNQDTFRTFLDTCEQNNLSVDQIPFESPPATDQTGFFHSTSIPIRTYQVTRSITSSETD